MKKHSTENRWDDPVFVLNKLINAVIFILIALGIITLLLIVIGIRH